MRLNNDIFFKNFNTDYLFFINDYYSGKTISYIKTEIKNQIKILLSTINKKQLKERNIDYWLIRGWSYDDSIKNIKNINKNRKIPVDNSILVINYWLKQGYSEDDAKKQISKIQKIRSNKGMITKKLNPNYKSPLSPFTKEYWLNNGIIDEKEIDFLIKSQRKLNVEYWIKKGYDMNESIKMVSDYQKQNSLKYINKWKDKKNKFEYKKQFNTKIEYYIDKGYTYDESKQKLKDRQKTFTLEKCIDKYGNEQGLKVYNDRQEKWIKKVFNENTCMSKGRSIVCDKFIGDLILSINNDSITNNFLYGKDEKFIYDKNNKRSYSYDLCYNKKIIEFHGDFWHSNPSIFKSDDIHRIKKIKCSEVWEFDKNKLQIAKKHNYEILVIWESEYYNNKEKVIEKCKKFLSV